MSINEHRQKLKNLRRDLRASGFFVDPENSYKPLAIRGTVEIEPDPEYVFADRVARNTVVPKCERWTNLESVERW